MNISNFIGHVHCLNNLQIWTKCTLIQSLKCRFINKTTAKVILVWNFELSLLSVYGHGARIYMILKPTNLKLNAHLAYQIMTSVSHVILSTLAAILWAISYNICPHNGTATPQLCYQGTDYTSPPSSPPRRVYRASAFCI